MSNKEVSVVEVGQFTIETGKVCVSDPCYDKGTWCAGEIENIKSGIWQTVAFEIEEGEWGNSISKLLAYHKDSVSDYEHLNDFTKIECDFSVGVDSGQAGIFDAKYYQDSEQFKGKEAKRDFGSIFYNHCCDITLDNRVGVIPFGCVSVSGYGDGVYTATKYVDENDSVIAVEIEFIQTEFICMICGKEMTEDENYYNDGLCNNCIQN